MTHATVGQAATGLPDETKPPPKMSQRTVDYCAKFADLEDPLHLTTAWTRVLDKLIEDNIAKGTVGAADEEIILVHAQLQAAIERMDAVFHGREPEEEEAHT